MCYLCQVLLRLLVDPLGAVFGIDDLLFAVQAVVAGQKIGYHAAQGVQGQALAAEELVGQQNGSDGAVGGSAEHGSHAHGPGEGVGQP